MGKIYAMMLSTTDDLFQEQIWTSLSEYIKESEHHLYFFCGKPIASTLDDEVYNNIIFNLMKDLPMDGLISLTGSLNHYIGMDAYQLWLNGFGEIPKVSISIALEGCSNVLLDNYESSYRLAEHISQHGYQHIGIINGPQNTSESLERYQGTIDGLKKFGLCISYMAQGDFSKKSGYLATRQLLENDIDVIICANDQMALGAYEAIYEKGLQIPADIAVIGFDDIEQAEILEVPLTTIRQPFEAMAKTAFDLLISNSMKTVKHSGEVIIRQSCGCKNISLDVKEMIERNRYYMDKYHEGIKEYNQMLQLHGKFDHVNSLEKLNAELETYFVSLTGSEFHLCLFECFKQKIEDPQTFVYPNKMLHQFGYMHGHIYEPSIYDTKNGLPQEIFEVSKSKSFLVYPVNLHDTSYGYIVCDAETARSKKFISLRKTIANVLNRIDMYQQLKAYSLMMETLASVDSMTGLLNRRGFFAITESVFSNHIKSGKTPSIIFCDVNGLKKVNDNYGHDVGDQMIIETANVLKVVFDGDVVARIGGDEFIIYKENSSKEIIDEILQRLSNVIAEYNMDDKMPFELSLEAGSAGYDISNPVSLDELISKADKSLYRKKKRLS